MHTVLYMGRRYPGKGARVDSVWVHLQGMCSKEKYGKQMKKKLKISKLKQKAERIFNRWIRLRSTDEYGYATCVTCGERKHYKELHAGHLKHGLDFVEDNQAPQCVGCNTYRGGRLDVYTIYVLDAYGRERIDELTRMKNAGQKFSRSELEEICIKYKKLGDEIEQQL